MSDERRSHKRLIVAIDAQWAIAPAPNWRTAKILDVSLLGASFQIDEPLQLERPLSFTLRASDVPVLPAVADLQWWRRMTSGRTLTLGVQFRAITAAWAAWLTLAGVE